MIGVSIGALVCTRNWPDLSNTPSLAEKAVRRMKCVRPGRQLDSTQERSLPSKRCTRSVACAALHLKRETVLGFSSSSMQQSFALSHFLFFLLSLSFADRLLSCYFRTSHIYVFVLLSLPLPFIILFLKPSFLPCAPVDIVEFWTVALVGLLKSWR